MSPPAELTLPSPGQISLLARTGAKWTLGFQFAQYGINALATILLARILLPVDFGLVGMAATLTTFCQLFTDFGLGWATIQRSEISRDQVSNLFWISSTVGAVLWAVCIVTGSSVASFYLRPELIRIIPVLGSALLLTAMAAQPIALLRRQMRLKLLAIIQIISVIAGGIVGVGMSLAKFHYWSIIGQALTTQFVTLILVMLYSGLHISFPRPCSGTLRLVRFGGFLTAFVFLSYLAKTMDNILVGRFLGPEQLGFYTRAYFLMTLPTVFAAGGLQSVIVPALVALKQDPDHLIRAYNKATAAVANIAFPMITGLAITAHELTLVVYGAKWASVAPILMVLSVGGLFYSVQTFSWLFVVNGKERQLFIWGMIMAGALVPSFLVGVGWGVFGVAAAYSFTTACFLTPVGFYFTHRYFRIPLLPTVKTLAGPLFASLVMAAGVWCVGAFASAYLLQPLPLLMVKVVVGVAIYGLLRAKDVRLLIGSPRFVDRLLPETM